MPRTLLRSAPCSPIPPTFDMLIARIRAGDEQALEQLLDSIAVQLRRAANECIGSALRTYIDADDLVQRVALILWDGLRDGKFAISSPRHLVGLVRVLMKRQAAKVAASFKREMSMTATFEGNLGATVADQRLLPAADPVGVTEAREKIQLLMQRVSDEDRRMLELLLEGHSIAAAARVLLIEPAALRMRLSRLRVRVRRVHPVRVAVRKHQRE